ncbi:MAG: glutaredoxin family protein, partial [Steroidobacteraceae bacterium]
MSEWIVYSRQSCSLCETFVHELADLLGPEVEKVRLIDITTDPELEARYGLKIPVLVIDGDVVCMYR